jgi:hypothetical protein
MTGKTMRQKRYWIVVVAFFCLVLPPAAGATQTHGDPEGLLVHQASHIFFAFSMGLLIYWLRSRGLVRSRGWRWIQYAALLFMLWTADAFLVHTLDELSGWIEVSSRGPWEITIRTDGSPFLGVLYYLAKLDHLLCVPAMLLLFMGIRELNREEGVKEEAQ